METMTFPRYSPDDIISYLRSHILEGAEARNLVKGDVFGSTKVREGGAGQLRAPPAPVWGRTCCPRNHGVGWNGVALDSEESQGSTSPLGPRQEARWCHQQHPACLS